VLLYKNGDNYITGTIV